MKFIRPATCKKIEKRISIIFTMSQISSTPLLTRIIERIRQDGPLTFAEYMRMALYDPEYGYYTSGPAKMGWGGDYFTSSDISSLFANCLGRQLFVFWQKLKCPRPFRVLEQGAGRGHLGAEVRAWAEQEAPDLAAALDYQGNDIRTGQDVLSMSNVS